MWHGHDHMLDDGCVLACRDLQDNVLTGTIPTELGLLTSIHSMCKPAHPMTVHTVNKHVSVIGRPLGWGGWDFRR